MLLHNNYIEKGRRCPHPGYLVVLSACHAGVLLCVLSPAVSKSPAGPGALLFPVIDTITVQGLRVIMANANQPETFLPARSWLIGCQRCI